MCGESFGKESTFLYPSQRAPAFRELGDPALPHFPKFLPALPDEHTFNRTPGELSSTPNDLKVCYNATLRAGKCSQTALVNVKMCM